MSEVPESPQTRIETYLAGALGQPVVLPEPVTRLEQYLKAIAESGGGGGGLMPVIIYAESHTTIETYVVPVLTDAQILAAYNGIMAGKVVVVVDDLDTIAMQVFDASNIAGTAIRLIFTDKMILNYKEGGEIEATPIAGGTAPVQSVNTKTGIVVLSASDILAQNSQSIQNNLERIDDDVADANDAIDELSTRVDNLQNIGRFLAIWNATTGEPTSEPPESPYSYRTGDYFRIGTVGNRIPTGATYTTGGINYETTTDTLAIGDIYYYDGTVWRRQASTGGGTVQDVQVNGTSILAGGVANIEDFDGASSTSAGTAGLVPAPLAADAGKFLKADGTWAEAGGGSGPNVVQTTGTSTTDVMSQKATTDMVLTKNVSTPSKNSVTINIDSASRDFLNTIQTVTISDGGQARNRDAYSILIGDGDISNSYSIGIGNQISAYVNGDRNAEGKNVLIGGSISVVGKANTMLGAFSSMSGSTNRLGCVGLGSYTGGNLTANGIIDAQVKSGFVSQGYGYNGTAYRLLTGIHDGQSAHDAATVNQLNTLIDSINSAMNTSIPHIGNS